MCHTQHKPPQQSLEDAPQQAHLQMPVFLFFSAELSTAMLLSLPSFIKHMAPLFVMVTLGPWALEGADPMLTTNKSHHVAEATTMKHLNISALCVTCCCTIPSPFLLVNPTTHVQECVSHCILQPFPLPPVACYFQKQASPHIHSKAPTSSITLQHETTHLTKLQYM